MTIQLTIYIKCPQNVLQKAHKIPQKVLKKSSKSSNCPSSPQSPHVNKSTVILIEFHIYHYLYFYLC